VVTLATATIPETAAGTSIVTMQLAKVMPDDTVIDATDLKQAKIGFTLAKITLPRNEWRICNAMLFLHWWNASVRDPL
jgi:hypothetical protein